MADITGTDTSAAMCNPVVKTADSVPLLCMECAQCSSRCFLSDAYPEMNPRKLARKVLTDRGPDITDSEFLWACTLCGRCTTDCPMDIRMDEVVRYARGLARTEGHAPERLLEGVRKAIDSGNNAGLDSEALQDMVEWLVEEVEDEIEGVEEGDLAVELDRQGAEILYLPNPREYTTNPQMFQAYLKFFHYAGADWTMSTRVFDITNWAYYLGDHDSTITLIRNVVNEARRLGVKTLLSTECGHGFKILRKDAETWLGESLGFEVISVVELAYRYVREGRLSLSPGSVDAKVTYHDPCNVGRKIGIYEEPRELIRSIVTEFIELWPNRRYSLCCGGGGSVAQNADMGSKRLEHAEKKRDQILATGADILTTCCQNCLSQLEDLKSRYNMPIQVKSVIELLVESMEQSETG